MKKFFNCFIIVQVLLVNVELILAGLGKEKPPNIVVILGDDIGFNDVGFHGNNRMKTPNIDALGYNGIILNKHYSLPICTPSRAAFLTGNYAIRSGFQGVPQEAGENRALPKNMPTMAEHLKKLGYNTHLVGKWHLGSGHRSATPTQRGFDTHFGYWNGYIGYFNYLIPYISDNVTVQGIDMHDGFEPVSSVLGKYSTDVFTERAEDIIKEHNKEKPLFLYLAHLAAHTGYNDVELAVQNETANDEEFGYIEDKKRRLYAGIMKSFDDSVGRVVKALEQKGILDNTIVLVFSDNGGATHKGSVNTASNWPLRGIKMSVAEGGVRTIATVWSKKFHFKGRVSNELIHISDWLPTFYAAAGGNVRDLGSIDGINQWNVLKNNFPTKRREMLLNIDEKMDVEAIIGFNGRYKLMNVKNPDDRYGYESQAERDKSIRYDLDAVLNSNVNKGLKTMNTKPLTSKDIWRLRRSATIDDCRKPNAEVNVTFALFDLINDPCETKNIARRHPIITRYLNERLEAFRRVLVPQINTIVDPCSNPNYYNGYWSTWLSDPSPSCQI